MDVSRLRQLFPVTQQCVFLNNAAESPLNTAVRQRLEEYIEIVSTAPHNKPSVRTPVRARLASLLGGEPSEYALVTSTGVGVGIAAAGYNWRPGDNVVVPSDEHWNNAFPWLALKSRGVDVRVVPVGEDNRVCTKRIAEAVDRNTRIVTVAAVRFNSGFRTDLKSLSSVAHAHGALFMVDGIQAAGVVPLNVEEDGIDILACAGFKWLLGMPGTGFLYVNKAAQEMITPVMPGMFAAEDNLNELNYLGDARRYETGSIAYPLFYAWTAGLELLQEIGIENIHSRVLELTDRLINGLLKKNLTITSPVANIAERSAILTFTAGSHDKNQVLFDRLKGKNIIITLRGSVCRVSPSFYNTEEDVDQFLDALD